MLRSEEKANIATNFGALTAFYNCNTVILLYNFIIRLYTIGIHVAAWKYGKAKHWVKGRRNWEIRYAQAWHQKNPQKSPCIWMHCASLGEFEQGRPLIESLRQKYPEKKIVLSFFSPSGYEIRKNYKNADYVCYLPADTKLNALKFIELFQPMLSIFVKYEFWYHYLSTLQKKQIPTILISANFRPAQVFFNWYGVFFRKLLPGFSHIFLQNKNAATLLQAFALQNFSLASDTRVDRVIQIAHEAPDFSIVAAFAAHHKILIAGSTWQPDELLLAPFVNKHLPPNWKLIIAPHHISKSRLDHIETVLELPLLRYSEASEQSATVARILLIDNIGMLSALYRYGHLAYIGGGFGAGIHNTLEPLAFGLPVIFGPKYTKFEEAVQLIQQQGAFSVTNTEAFFRYFTKLENVEFYQNAAQVAKNYILTNQGATEKIMQFIEKQYFER